MPNNKNIVTEPNIWKFLMWGLAIGTLLVLFFCTKTITIIEGINKVPAFQNILNFFTAVGTSMLIGGASYSGGAFLGFLFGIPRIVQNPSTATALKTQNTILQNDNLVQISDWLTKIIVGVGLTQLYNIPKAIQMLGTFLQGSFLSYPTSDPTVTQTARNGAIVTFLYFIIVGFLSAYLWTRIYFSKMLAQNERDMEDLVKEKEEELQAYSTTFSEISEELKNQMKIKKENDSEESDPEKGKWGGKTKNNGKQVTATVVPTTNDPDLFTVTFEVSSTDGKELTGEVTFHLHPTFSQPLQIVKPVNGVAKLSVISYGAFTAGIECDNGLTKLEIDLAKDVPDAPAIFKAR